MRPKLNHIGYLLALTALLVLFTTTWTVKGQQAGQAEQLLSPGQLDDLVAPIALYPDPLISEVLVAVTYPLELVEANQWLHRNPELSGMVLTQAVRNQMWDSSVQGLVAFPEVLNFLTEDIAWTTTLGNAFLAQEGDVMDAIQRMRARAAKSGRLSTSSQLEVTRIDDSGQSVYQVMPPEPEVLYVPVYDPNYIWGTASYYPYANWSYPVHSSTLYFNRISLGLAYGSGWRDSSGWVGWNDWGWRPAWGSHSVFVNNAFIAQQKFNGNHQVQNGTTHWRHDETHRQGVPYSTPAVAQRFGSNGPSLNSRPGNLPVSPQVPNNNGADSRQKAPIVRNDGVQPNVVGSAINGFRGGVQNSPNPNAAAAVLARLATPSQVQQSRSVEARSYSNMPQAPTAASGQTAIVNAGQQAGRTVDTHRYTNIPQAPTAARGQTAIVNAGQQAGRTEDTHRYANMPQAPTAARGQTAIVNAGQQAGRTEDTHRYANMPQAPTAARGQTAIVNVGQQAGRTVDTHRYTNIPQAPTAAAPVRGTFSNAGQQATHSSETSRVASASQLPHSAPPSGQSGPVQVNAPRQQSVQQSVPMPVGSTTRNEPQTPHSVFSMQSPASTQTSGGGRGRR